MAYDEFRGALMRLFLRLLPSYIGEAGVGIGTKIKPSDGTPVADLDNYALAEIRKLIEQHFPADCIIGEEDGKSAAEIQQIINRQNQFQWTVDGLDGTGNARAGLNSYGAAVARKRGNQILFAAIFLPIDYALRRNGFLWAENGQDAREWLDREGRFIILKTASVGDLDRMVVTLEGSSRRLFEPPVTNLGSSKTTRCSFSSCVAASAVARGRASALVTVGNMPWDNWPAIGIIEAAGGIVTDWQGNPRNLASCENMIAAGNAQDLAEVVESLANRKEESWKN